LANDKRVPAGLLSGAAFLMAVSAIGPGFLTQTTEFTVRIGASLAFAILLSILIDIGAQLNTWRVICLSGRRGHEVADAMLPGLGWVVTLVIVAGSFVFNLGNLSGCALGLEALWGMPQAAGASASALLAVFLFLLPRMLVGVDWFSKVLGVAMIAMTVYILVLTAPPVGEAALRAVWPQQVEASMIVTMIGGTIGGYIMFSGAHRLLDGGITGASQVGLITRASVQGILITGLMRIVLFLAVFGVVSSGATLSADRPVFDAFRAGAGSLGYVLSCLLFWAAAVTSVVGCSYTAISFLPVQFTPRQRSWSICGFTLLSLIVTLILLNLGQKPTPLLIAAGTINGVMLPIVLGVVLWAAYRRSVVGDYRHPWWAGVAGGLAWLGTLYMAYHTIAEAVRKWS
jgi:Mn2+/Fe2+ NRAMP family transporter